MSGDLCRPYRTIAATTDTYGYVGPSDTVVAIDGVTDRISVTGADGSRLATKDGATTAFVIADLHGNIAGAMAGGSSALVDAIRYDAYGQTLAAPYAGAGAVALDHRYQDRLNLSPAGDPLYAAGARDYAPALGAFTSLDTVLGSASAPRTLNRFLYALANPATFIDPTGHFVSNDFGGDGCGRQGCATTQPDTGGAGGIHTTHTTQGTNDTTKTGGSCGSQSCVTQNGATPTASVWDANKSDRDEKSIGPAPNIWVPLTRIGMVFVLPDGTPLNGEADLGILHALCSGGNREACRVVGQATERINYWQGQYCDANPSICRAESDQAFLSLVFVAEVTLTVAAAIDPAPADEAIPGGAAAATANRLSQMANDLETLSSAPQRQAFSYTFASRQALILEQGLPAGSWATPNGRLSPLQAQIELALPPNRGLPNMRVSIDLQGLSKAGYALPGVSRVGNYVYVKKYDRVYSGPGGGYEMQFPYGIPPEFLRTEAIP